jgi:hypothetical protein
MTRFRTGIGHDIHRLVPSRELVLGGVTGGVERSWRSRPGLRLNARRATRRRRTEGPCLEAASGIWRIAVRTCSVGSRTFSKPAIVAQPDVSAARQAGARPLVHVRASVCDSKFLYDTVQFLSPGCQRGWRAAALQRNVSPPAPLKTQCQHNCSGRGHTLCRFADPKGPSR